MATSGTFLFNPTIAELLDDAYERCGKDPRDLTLYHIDSARRSANLMLADWGNDGIKQWAMEEETVPTTVGMQSFAVATGTIDIFSMVLEREGVVTPMVPISRVEYHQIHDKDLEGRPDRYFIQRDRDSQTAYIWQAGENTTDVIRYWRLRQLEDIGRAHNQADIPHRFHEAFCACWAAKLAEKWAPDREGGLIAKAKVAFQRAFYADRERVALRLSFGKRGGR